MGVLAAQTTPFITNSTYYQVRHQLVKILSGNDLTILNTFYEQVQRCESDRLALVQLYLYGLESKTHITNYMRASLIQHNNNSFYQINLRNTTEIHLCFNLVY